MHFVETKRLTHCAPSEEIFESRCINETVRLQSFMMNSSRGKYVP